MQVSNMQPETINIVYYLFIYSNRRQQFDVGFIAAQFGSSGEATHKVGPKTILFYNSYFQGPILSNCFDCL